MTSLSSILMAILVLYEIPGLYSLNILQIAYGWSSSHVLSNFRIAKTLRARGHNVTILLHRMSSNLPLKNIPDGAELIDFHPNFSHGIQDQGSAIFQSMAFVEGNLTYYKDLSSVFRQLTVETCVEVLNDHQLLDDLRSKNFDMTISHFFSSCPVGWSQRIGVKKFVWIATGAFIMENIAWKANLPNLVSYMPCALMKGATDRMTFMQRVQNFLWASMMYMALLEDMGYLPYENEKSVFSQPPYHTDKDPDLVTLSKETVTILISGEPFLDFPKPLLPGMVHMGEMETKVIKKLPEEWQKIMDESEAGVIIFSFGTVANTSTMPFSLKEAFFKAFVNFPNYTIIWRLEGQLPKDLPKFPHIRLVKWFPQSDLLYHKNLKLFITHGGYNSYLESAQAGIPLVLMPLLNDQYANAERARRRGIGLVLDKHQSTAESIEKAIRTVLTDPSFTKNARYLSSVLKDQIIPNELLALHRIEKIAKAGHIWPTMKAARQLNWIQYFCLDVAVMSLGLTGVCVYVLCSFVPFVWILIQKLKTVKRGN